MDAELPDDMQPDGAARSGEADPRYMVPALSRGLTLLRLFDSARPAQTLGELASGLGITRSAAYRLAYTLEQDGFIARDAQTRRYRLASRVLELGFAYLSAQGMPEVAAPHLRRLSEATGAAAHLVVLDGWHVVYLARSTPSPASAMVVSNLQVGARLPCHLTASGRVLMAGLDAARLRGLHRRLADECPEPPPPLDAMLAQAAEDRARGFVFRTSIIDPSFRTFAAPVHDGAGAVLAAINVIGVARAMSEPGGETVLREVVPAAAAAIARDLGHAPALRRGEP